jgi:hypothetical protein
MKTARQTKQYREYLARKAEYNRTLADAAMGHLSQGGSIRLTTYTRSTVFTAASIRRVGDDIQVYGGKVRGLDSWMSMDSGQLARQVGMETFANLEADRPMTPRK